MPAGATTAPSERRPVATLRGPGRSCRSRLLTLVAARFSRRPPWHLEHARARSRGSTSAPRFLGSSAEPHTLFARPAAPSLHAPNGRSNLHNDTYASDVYFPPGRPTRPVEQRHSTPRQGLRLARLRSATPWSRFASASSARGSCSSRRRRSTRWRASSCRPAPRPRATRSAASRARVLLPRPPRRRYHADPNPAGVIAERSTCLGPRFALTRVDDLTTTVPPADANLRPPRLGRAGSSNRSRRPLTRGARPQALARQRVVHEAATPPGRRPVVPHGRRLPRRADGLRVPRRRGFG